MKDVLLCFGEKKKNTNKRQINFPPMFPLNVLKCNFSFLFQDELI